MQTTLCALVGLSHPPGRGQPSPPTALPQHEPPVLSGTVAWPTQGYLLRASGDYISNRPGSICKQDKGVSGKAFFPAGKKSDSSERDQKGH